MDVRPGQEAIRAVPVHEGLHDAYEFLSWEEIESQAWQLIEAREQIAMAEVKPQEYKDNARTALLEAMTASGHLSKVELKGSPEEVHHQVISRLLNGWDDNLPEHEKTRRFLEICNELVIHRTLSAVAVGVLPETTEVLETSDYPEQLKGKRLGYRDKNKKGMVRSSSLRKNAEGGYDRIIEQVSRSNGTWRSTFQFFMGCGIETRDTHPDIAALEKPIIYTRQDYTEGVVDIIRLLDRYSGRGVRYGDNGERAKRSIPYEELRRESARREAEIEHYIVPLAALEEQLDVWVRSNKLTKQERQQLFEGEVNRILNAICALQPEYAADTFGEAAAPAFYQASYHIANGDTEQAYRILTANQHLKEEVTWCGVTMSVAEAQEHGLKVNDFGSLVEEGKENWKWKKGVCQVPVCPTRPGKTEVGPCSVCRSCQAKFDIGEDPTKPKISLYNLLEAVTS
jgi:hypothetical protein